jgi:hypothetical protein
VGIDFGILVQHSLVFPSSFGDEPVAKSKIHVIRMWLAESARDGHQPEVSTEIRYETMAVFIWGYEANTALNQPTGGNRFS